MTLGDAARLGRRAGRNVGRPISRAGSLRMRASEKTARSIARGACSAAGRLRKDHRRSRLQRD
ncbi:hypothetical protein [Burkholderia pseudomallei]|uniref:hypothetical protein n=1 Tax=Burkholderia pseudomallei TaxID=28450 RepID=UPI0015C2C2FE|nr:hypothetical protein [Burkholderia pseudomallei]